MPLPKDPETPWPPILWRPAYLRYGEHSAWYSGDPQSLTRFYAGYAGMDRTGFFDPTTTAQPYISVWRRFMFWARQIPGAITRVRLHVPLAADISSISSDLLFSDAPKMLVQEAHETSAPEGATKAQDRLDLLVEQDGIMASLLEAGEVASALGGIYLRVGWDKEFAPDRPLLTAIHPDAVIPEFLYGRLVAATVWRVVMDTGKKVYRQLERYEMSGDTCHILTGLFEGTQDKLGINKPLSMMPETSSIVSSMTDPTELPQGLIADVDTKLPRIPLVYIPNMRPNRTDRTSPLGRSDYAGVEGMLDALDEVWTSWMRDIRLGRARLIVPEEYLQTQRRGQGSTFDLEREVWEGLKMNPQDGEIKPQQFAIRTQEHSQTAEDLIRQIVGAAGYSGATFGLKGPENIEQTATEVHSLEARTLATRDRKIGYWSSALSDIFELLLMVDKQEFNGPGVFRPKFEFPQSIQASVIDTANAINFLSQANALSLKTKIQMAHSDWSPEMVAAEMAAIQSEAQAQQAHAIALKSTAPPELPPASGPPKPAGPNAPKPPETAMLRPGSTTGTAPTPSHPISQPAQ